MPVERRRIFFSGRVQGVGFRYTAHRLAQNFAVAGYVRNLPDGRVELVAEGEPSEAARFLEAVRREMGRYIQEASDDVEPPAEPPLKGFSIRF
jgi:acylphosphatase